MMWGAVGELVSPGTTVLCSPVVLSVVVGMKSVPCVVVSFIVPFIVPFNMLTTVEVGSGPVSGDSAKRFSWESNHEPVPMATTPRTKEIVPMTTPLMQIKRKYLRMTIVMGGLSLRTTAGGAGRVRWWLEFDDATLGLLRGYHPDPGYYKQVDPTVVASVQMSVCFACGWFLKAQV